MKIEETPVGKGMQYYLDNQTEEFNIPKFNLKNLEVFVTNLLENKIEKGEVSYIEKRADGYLITRGKMVIGTGLGGAKLCLENSIYKDRVLDILTLLEQGKTIYL